MTRFNNKYPYTDFHELNADWLLETVKDAADTVDGYDGRLTRAEGAINTLQSEVETPGTGLLDRMEDAEDKIGTLTLEVETPSTGLLDRVTTIEGKVEEHDGDINNIEGRMVTYDQNFIDINNQFISDQGRIRELETYRTEAQVKIGNLGYSIAPLFDEDSGYNAGDYVMSPTLKLHRARVNIPAGTADIHDLTQFRPTDVQNALSDILPTVTSSDAGDVLTVDSNGDWVATALNIPAVESGTIPYSHGALSANNAYWYRVGEVVTVTTQFHANYAGSIGVLFTLPYVPKTGFGILFNSFTSNIANLQALVSGSNGDVSLITSTSAANDYGVSFSYVRA